jgi:murein DD-endopeptidase MepM/ murein hydrolase activator NlpD
MTAKFTPENQDKMAVAYLEKKRRGKEWLAGKITNRQYIEDLAREWGAFRSYSGYVLPGNSGKIGPEKIEAALNKVKSGSFSQQPSGQIPRQASLPALPPTDTLGGGVQRYGASRRGGRKHAGTDFDISGNQKFYSRIGGIVTKIGYDPNGYGNYVDIYNPQLKVYERIAEAATVIVKKGQTIKPGQAVVQGESSTGVIHYEIRKNSGYGFSGTLDPVAFLKSPSTQTSVVASSPAQIAAPAQQTNAVPFSLTPERSGQDIIIIDQPRQQQNIITSASGGGGQGPSAISDFDLLNNFIKNKLLLDLAYV